MKRILKLIPALLLVCIMAYGLVVHAATPETYKLNFVYLDGTKMVSVYVTAGESLKEAGVEIPEVSGNDKNGKPATSWWSSTNSEAVTEDYVPSGDRENISIAPYHDHTETIISGTPATCVSEGTGESVVCTGADTACGEVVSAPAVLPVDPTAHRYSEEWDSDADYHWKTCVLCGEGVSDKEAHTPGAGPTETEPQRCTVCAKVLKEELGHECKNYVQLQEEVEPTCVTDGSIACYVCTDHETPKYYKDENAEEEITDLSQLVIPATGEHEVVELPGVEPTCTEEGQKGIQVCSICDTVIGGGEVIDPLGHDYEQEYNDTHHWMACTRCDDTTGLEEHTIENQTCTECGYKTCQAHVLVKVERVEPGCTEPGCDGYYKCESCGQCYRDAIGSINITNHMDNLIIEPTGHTEVVVDAIEPTCTEEGKTEGLVCKECGTITKEQETIPKKAHTEVTVPGTEATCEAEGKGDGVKCEVCGIMIKEQEIIPKKAHTEVTVPGTEATCTAQGKTDGTKCEVCGTILKEQEIIPAKGHTEVTILGTEATCTVDGLTDKVTCEVCGIIIKEQEIIPAKGHTEAVVIGTAATCEAEGRTDGIKCEVCDTVIKEQEPIAALGHEYSDQWSFDGNGHWHTCIRCDSRIDEEVHTPDTDVEGATQTCTVCGYVITVPDDHTHQLKFVEAIASSCTQKGTKAHYVCEECGRFFEDAEGSIEVTLEQLSIPATSENGEHTFGEWVITKEATETENGLRERTCSGCGYVEVQEISSTGSKNEPPETDDPAEAPQQIGDAATQTGDNETGQTKTDNKAADESTSVVGVQSPLTGERQNMAIWIVLISVCGALVWMGIARRRNEN